MTILPLKQNDFGATRFEQQQQCFAPHALRPAADRRKILTAQVSHLLTYQSPACFTDPLTILTAQSPRPKSSEETPKKTTPRRKPPPSTLRTPKVDTETEKQRQKQQVSRLLIYQSPACSTNLTYQSLACISILNDDGVAGRARGRRPEEAEGEAPG